MSLNSENLCRDLFESNADSDQNYVLKNGNQNLKLNNIDNLLDRSSFGSSQEGNGELPSAHYLGRWKVDVRIYGKEIYENNGEPKKKPT